MRNLLLILLLANTLYFMWGWFDRDEEGPGVEIVAESDLGPPLSISQAETDSVASVGAVLGSGEPSDLAAVVGRTCVTLGPLNRADAEAAEMRHEGEGMQTNVRSQMGQIFVGHWVQIRDVPDRAAGNQMLETLSEGGIGEAYIVETDDEGMKISLGLFGDRDRAERIELQAQSLGLGADITPRFNDGMLYFVDIGLPSGRGAGQIIERYGEDKVLLRDAATCPN
ncbi:MAG: hypothetical protein QNJ00_05940 [Woeseiaceae bacterium]|nr:hypothetical protein [Woeseiaceae bacterium]